LKFVCVIYGGIGQDLEALLMNTIEKLCLFELSVLPTECNYWREFSS